MMNKLTEKEMKKRRALLREVAKKSEKLIKHHDNLSERANDLLNELVDVLAAREQVFTLSSTGLNNPFLIDVITTEEHDDLVYNMRRSTCNIYPGQFSVTWMNAVERNCKHDATLKMRLSGLINKRLSTNHYSLNEPGSGASSYLMRYARKIAHHRYKGVTMVIPNEDALIDKTEEKVVQSSSMGNAI